MERIEDLARDFLAQKRIAVAGVSRSGNDAGRLIYDKLKQTGHEVYAVNPHAKEINGNPCYPDLQSLPDKVDGVVALTTPDVTEQIVQQCIEAGVPRIWMHRSFGSSVSEAAVALCLENGIKVIPGWCPMMFQEPVDFGHRCFRWWFTLTGVQPGQVG